MNLFIKKKMKLPKKKKIQVIKLKKAKFCHLLKVIKSSVLIKSMKFGSK